MSDFHAMTPEQQRDHVLQKAEKVLPNARNCRNHAQSAALQKAHKAVEMKRRQQQFQQRFEILGWWYTHRFRKMRFAQGLQTAFETPAMYSIAHLDQTYWIPQRQYYAAWTYAIETDHTVTTKQEFESFLRISWELFDVGVSGKIDYRELLNVWSLFQLDWRTSSSSYLEQCFRNQLAPGEQLLSRTDMLRVLMTLCTAPEEASLVLTQLDWSLVPERASEALDLQGQIKQSNEADAEKYDADAHYLLGIERHLANVESKRGDHRRTSKLAERKAYTANGGITDKSGVSIGQFRTFLQRSKGLLKTLNDLLVARLPAVLRSARQRHLAAHAGRAAERHMERLRHELAMRDAMLMWSHQSMRRFFGIWKEEIGREIILRRKENLFRRLRAMRKWNAWTSNKIDQRMAKEEAAAHAEAVLVDNTFNAWATRTATERRLTEFKRTKAEASYRFALKERLFFGWHLTALTTKAYTHQAMVCKRRGFKGWLSAMETLTYERKQDAEVKAVQDSVAKGKEVLTMLKIGDDELQAEALEEIKRAEVENERIRAELEWSRIEQEAIVLAETKQLQARQARQAREAETELRLQQQRHARRARVQRNKAEWEQEFADKWAARMMTEEVQQRTIAEAIVDKGKDKAVKAHMAETLQEILTGTGGVESVQQAFSLFQASYDSEEDCIVFTHVNTGEVVTTNGLKNKEAKKVAKEHAIGRLLAQAMVRLQQERDNDHDQYEQRWAGSIVQGAFLRRKWRKAILHQLRSVTQQLVDPDNGEVYFYDVSTGLRSSSKPVLFRREEVHPQPMAWRRNDPETGGSIYTIRRMPWQRNTEPPAGYRLCMSCGAEFADRLCAGDGCHRFAYCFHCWISHHPYEDPLFEHLYNVVHIAVDRARCEHFPTEYASKQVWSPELNFGVFSEKGFYAACSQYAVDPNLIESTDF